MHFLDTVLTGVVFSLFGLLTLYYLLFILHNTLRDRAKLENWKDVAGLGGILLLQIGSAGFTGFFLYFIFFEGAAF